MDEVGYFAAGLRHWTTGKFDFYRVNPPLTRIVATLPVRLDRQVLGDSRHYPDLPGDRAEFESGSRTINLNGPGIFRYFAFARVASTLFSIFGAVVCFRWAKELYGANAGIMAATMWCFSPNILAHAAMITPDAGATAFGVLAACLFWRWLREPSWERAITAGLGLGLAELTKFTWIVLFPLWAALLLVHRLTVRGRLSWKNDLSQLAAIMLIALYLINAGYAFEGSFSRLKTFEFVSEPLAGPMDERPGATANRFRSTWVGEIPVPFPRNYVMGIDVQKHDFEGIQRPSYLRRRWKDSGWWYYYLYALLVKLPIGTWILLLLAVYVTIRYRRNGSTDHATEPADLHRPLAVTWRDELVLLAPAVVVLVLVSSQTGFNHHMRYVLPAFPFGFIFISKVAAYVRWPGKTPVADAPGSVAAQNPGISQIPGFWFTVVAAGALLWSVGSSFWVYPHSLSYFNELAGGPMNGHAHLVDSNIDWGQDLLYLKDWYDDHPEARPIHLAYFGGFDPHVAGFEYKLPPKAPEPGWHAVSVNFMRGMQFWIWDGESRHVDVPPNRFTYFQHFKPTARAGYSIYIYHITYDDAQRVRRKLGLPPLPPRK